MTAPELYASECCGAVFVPGHGPDNMVEAEQGTRLILDSEEREVPVTAAGAEVATKTERWERTHRITLTEASLYDAMRAGSCPCCGETTPGLHLVADGDGLGGHNHE